MRRYLLLGLFIASSSLFAACGPKEKFCPETKGDPLTPGWGAAYDCNPPANDGSMYGNVDGT